MNDLVQKYVDALLDFENKVGSIKTIYLHPSLLKGFHDLDDSTGTAHYLALRCDIAETNSPAPEMLREDIFWHLCPTTLEYHYGEYDCCDQDHCLVFRIMQA